MEANSFLASYEVPQFSQLFIIAIIVYCIYKTFL